MHVFRKHGRGFSLIELLVSISIIALISGIIITKNGAFNGAVLLRNQTYAVAFALREAQMMAVSGARVTSGESRYGVYFDTAVANRQTYQIFQDLNENGRWDPAENIGAVRQLDKRFKIRTVTYNGGFTDGIMSITFTRPNFDAVFTNSGGTTRSGPVYIDVAQLAATDLDTNCGKVRRVEVTAPGLIAVTEYNNC